MRGRYPHGHKHAQLPPVPFFGADILPEPTPDEVPTEAIAFETSIDQVEDDEPISESEAQRLAAEISSAADEAKEQETA